MAVPALRRLRRPQGLRPARRGQQAALPGGRDPDHDAHQRDQHPGAGSCRPPAPASQQTRLQQAKDALPNAQAQLAAAQGEENSLLDNFQVTNSVTNGLLIRLEALDQLSAKGGSLSLVRWLLFLLFLVIEILPVSVKLMQQPGLYEQILETADRTSSAGPSGSCAAGGRDAAAGRPEGSEQDLRPSAGTADSTSRPPAGTCPTGSSCGSSSGPRPSSAAARARLRLKRQPHRARADLPACTGPTGWTRSCATWRTPGREPATATGSAPVRGPYSDGTALTMNGARASNAVQRRR